MRVPTVSLSHWALCLTRCSGEAVRWWNQSLVTQSVGERIVEQKPFSSGLNACTPAAAVHELSCDVLSCYNASGSGGTGGTEWGAPGVGTRKQLYYNFLVCSRCGDCFTKVSLFREARRCRRPGRWGSPECCCSRRRAALQGTQALSRDVEACCRRHQPSRVSRGVILLHIGSFKAFADPELAC